MATPAAPAYPQEPQGPIYVDTQHDDMVHDAQLDYYGAKLATSSSGEWATRDFSNGRSAHTDIGVQHWISSLDFGLALTISSLRSHCKDLQRVGFRL